MIEAGSKAPSFQCSSTAGDVSLESFAGKNLVLYFYPKDNTPGCSMEAREFTALHDELTKLDTQVIGVSRDSIKSHEDFIDKENIRFPLISDETEELCKSYEVLKEKSNFGKSYIGIVRTTFLIDKDGVIQKIWKNVKVNGHAEKVLALIRSLPNL